MEGAPDCLYLTCSEQYPYYQTGRPLALRADGTALVAGPNGTLASIDFSSSSRVACVVDPADYAQLRCVAPGQLLTLFGTDLAPTTPFIPASGLAPSSATFGVFFNGIAAPILYSSGQQVNVQVPYEIAGQATVQMQATDSQDPLPLAETHTLAVVDRQPAVFLSPGAYTSPFPGYAVCGATVAIGEPAVALNADGTLNGCTNPAIAGSVVTIFVDGLGPVTPAPATGTIAPAPAVTLSPGVGALDYNLAPVSTTTSSVPGASTGVAQVQFKLPASPGPPAPVTVTPTVGGIDLRERLVLIWVRPN